MAPPPGDPKSSDVYRTITNRLENNLRPAFKVERYVKSGLSAGRDTLGGITFVPSNWYDILVALRVAKTLDGRDAFAEGGSPVAPNWALDASMGATIGKGFREIWWPKLSERPLSLDDVPGRRRPRWNAASSARFGEDPSNSVDQSSLHFAVAPDRCNIHIDQMGFVIGGTGGEVSIDPDFAQHLVNELLWKSLATRVFPDSLVDRLSVMLPSSSNEYSRAGITADLTKQKNYKVTLTGSCSIRGDFECSATVGISGKF
ncbi:MAG: hypothetical protein ACHQM4_10235 [Thermoanaerobaculia bacterium]